MYCPSCGSQNQVDIKFCTRCGTNLGVVSEALSGKFVPKLEPDERTVKLLKTYYDGRKSTAVGTVSLILGLTLLTLLLGAGMPERWQILALLGLGCLVYGAIAFIAGLAEWIESSSEMKALGIAASQPALPPAPQSVTTAGDRTPELAGGYVTDPITNPVASAASVTEHTTRQLDALSPRREDQPRSSE